MKPSRTVISKTSEFFGDPRPTSGSPTPCVRDAETPASGGRLSVGAVIGGVYRVVSHLGSGSMGTVLLAYDETLDRRVAIKFVHDALSDSGFRERFMAEAKAMARVSHPNVLQIHTFGEHKGAQYFVMEFVEGVTLEAWLDSVERPPPIVTALQILGGICEGVSAIHAADALHRDLKPSNILLDARLRPRVADLGLAILSRHYAPGKIDLVGTPAYMAPEIAMGEMDPALGERVDVYSLACIAYELFAGRPPFSCNTNVGLLLRHAIDAVPPMNRAGLDLPIELCNAVLRGLAKNPSQRTSTAEAFRREVIAGFRGDREPLRILIAEDDDTFRELLKTGFAVEFLGADLDCVADGQAALEAFDRKRPSVVILDLRMPYLNGLELTTLIRERDPSAAIPILVLTASGGAEEWRQLAAQGADRLLMKPVALDDVVSLVRRLLNEKSRRSSIPLA
jgi:eukaryotic-like serine/threonine-protein kinase